MPTKAKQLKEHPNVWVCHWTRREQIANAKAGGTLAEMKPKLKAMETS